MALATSAAIAGLSFLVAPAAWSEWIALLVRDAGRPLETVGWFVPIPVLPRLLAAVVIVAWGAATGRRWTIPVAVVLAMPVLWLNAFAVLAALVPLTERGRRLASWPPRRLQAVAPTTPDRAAPVRV
jgi:hypothetical protein